MTEEEKDSSHDQLRSIIEDKMHSLYSKGNIDDSEIDFSNLYSLEINNYDNDSILKYHLRQKYIKWKIKWKIKKQLQTK